MATVLHAKDLCGDICECAESMVFRKRSNNVKMQKFSGNKS